jgi:hypothetical protein
MARSTNARHELLPCIVGQAGCPTLTSDVNRNKRERDRSRRRCNGQRIHTLSPHQCFGQSGEAQYRLSGNSQKLRTDRETRLKPIPTAAGDSPNSLADRTQRRDAHEQFKGARFQRHYSIFSNNVLTSSLIISIIDGCKFLPMEAEPHAPTTTNARAMSYQAYGLPGEERIRILAEPARQRYTAKAEQHARDHRESRFQQELRA